MSKCECQLCVEFEIKENVIMEYKFCFLMFNRYPYLPGHLMLVPKRSVATLFDLNENEKSEIIVKLSEIQEKLLNCLKELHVTSTNIGINTGVHSGGSIPQHLHIHIVPRRSNDMNFMFTTIENSHPFHNYKNHEMFREQIEKEFAKSEQI